MNDPNIRAPRLLERYREEMLVRRYANRTITGYVSWVRQPQAGAKDLARGGVTEAPAAQAKALTTGRRYQRAP